MTTLKPNAHTALQDGPRLFSRDQLRKLARDVAPRHIRRRELDGRQLAYIEGWYAIAQANEIFGYGGWDRETVHFERIPDRSTNSATTCAYLARVRIRVRAGSTEIVREGTGWGSAGSSPAAHERALKAAETDATKRALSTFGPCFGLHLYDKDHPLKAILGFRLFDPDGRLLDHNLSPEGFCTGLRQLISPCSQDQQLESLQRHNAASLSELRTRAPKLRNAQGIHFADLLIRLLQRRKDQLSGSEIVNVGEQNISLPSSRAFHTGTPATRYTGQTSFRRSQLPPPANPGTSLVNNLMPGSVAEKAPGHSIDCDRPAVGKLAGSEAGSSPSEMAPSQPTGAQENSPVASSAETGSDNASADSLPPSRISHGLRIDKSKLWLSLERRLRDKRHLRRVGELPCLICNRQPSHAHHLRFAQRRGMSQKVSDEYVVPLCALHHGDLHRSDSEQGWWVRQNIDPLPISAQLWASSQVAKSPRAL